LLRLPPSPSVAGNDCRFPREMTAAGPASGRAAFRHPAFTRYWAARFLAFVAIMMQ